MKAIVKIRKEKGLELKEMEVPRPGVESELQLPAYTTAHGNAGSLTH